MVAIPSIATAAAAQPPAWKSPTVQDARAKVLSAIDSINIRESARKKVEAVWANVPMPASEDDLLTAVVGSASLVNANAAHLVAFCSQPRTSLVLPPRPWLADGSLPAIFADNLRLFYAGWLVHETMFDEAQEQLAGLQPGDVVAPASLLFYQSVVCHVLLNKESGLKSIDALLQGADGSPKRYVAMAKLMQEDLKELEDDSLDHISRRMDDIRRRLDLGRAGPKVRDVEDGVIRSLDKMIKKLEDQEQQQSANENSSLQSNRPASDSRPMGGKGPGQVTKKEIGSGSGWGDLPPKERDEAMQQIGRDFPSQYRDAIEQYFRRLASEGEKSGK
jgi:hypothetical protein